VGAISTVVRLSPADVQEDLVIVAAYGSSIVTLRQLQQAMLAPQSSCGNILSARDHLHLNTSERPNRPG
jgi:hypothetical protein